MIRAIITRKLAVQIIIKLGTRHANSLPWYIGYIWSRNFVHFTITSNSRLQFSPQVYCANCLYLLSNLFKTFSRRLKVLLLWQMGGWLRLHSRAWNYASFRGICYRLHLFRIKPSISNNNSSYEHRIMNEIEVDEAKVRFDRRVRYCGRYYGHMSPAECGTTECGPCAICKMRAVRNDGISQIVFLACHTFSGTLNDNQGKHQRLCQL